MTTQTPDQTSDTGTALPPNPVLCFETEVRAVRRLSPSFVRITFGGACLARFDDCGELGPRDLRIKVIAPVGGRQPAFVETRGDGWYQDWLAGDPRHRGEMRTYTVREVRSEGERSEVDIDFVLHTSDEPSDKPSDEHGAQSGPAADWAAAATVGDRLLLMGPNLGCAELYGGIEWRPPLPGTEPVRVLLVGDETAVPAIGSILATLPQGYVGRALLEVEEPEDFQELRTAAEVEITWLARSGRPRGERLAEAVRGAVPSRDAHVDVPDVDPELLWETPRDLGLSVDGDAPYVWIAGEAGVVKGLRRYLVGDVGLPRSAVSFMGYWRVGASI